MRKVLVNCICQVKKNSNKSKNHTVLTKNTPKNVLVKPILGKFQK